MDATEHDVAEVLQRLLDPNLDDPDDDSFYLMVQEIVSYEDAGVLTRDFGFVLRLSDRTEYQVTIVRSR